MNRSTPPKSTSFPVPEHLWWGLQCWACLSCWELLLFYFSQSISAMARKISFLTLSRFRLHVSGKDVLCWDADPASIHILLLCLHTKLLLLLVPPGTRWWFIQHLTVKICSRSLFSFSIAPTDRSDCVWDLFFNDMNVFQHSSLRVLLCGASFNVTKIDCWYLKVISKHKRF